MLKKTSYVGVDLGHYAMKVAQIEKTPQGWRVTRAASMFTPQNAMRDGVVHDVPTVAGALKMLLKHSGITAKNAIISVQGAAVVVRNVRVPKMPEATLRKSIRFEAGRYIPNSVEECYVEFEILGSPDESQMDILLVAAPNELVNSRAEVVQGAGLEVDIVDVGSFAANRALIETNFGRETQNETYALIDFGAFSTTVSVVSNGRFTLTRAVQSGSANFTEALRTFFDLSQEDAESGKAQLNVAELLEEKPRENPPLRVLHPYIDELVREVRRSINYYESQQTDGKAPEPVTSIVLTGGGAQLQGLAAYMQAKLNVSVTALGTFDNPLVTNFTSTELGQGLDLSVVTGLAMRPILRAA